MSFINKITNEYPFTLAQMQAAYPITIFPIPFEENFEEFAYVHATYQPEHDPSTQRVVEVDPIEMDGEWQQAWEVAALTAEEIEAARIAALPAVPQTVSKAQGKASLIRAGLWPSVLAFIAAIVDDTERLLAEVALNDTQEWRRDSPFLNMAKEGLGMTDEQLDALFVAASGETL